MNQPTLQEALAALHHVVQDHGADQDGVLAPRLPSALEHAAHVLHSAGLIETIERRERYSGRNQAMWQGRRLKALEQAAIGRE